MENFQDGFWRLKSERPGGSNYFLRIGLMIWARQDESVRMGSVARSGLRSLDAVIRLSQIDLVKF